MSAASPQPSVGKPGVGRNPRNLRIRVRTAAHIATWQLGRLFPDSIPLVFVVAYPKAGTTWATQLVADYLMLPFPRYPMLPIAFEAVVHGHDTVKPWYRRGVYMMRDGRDALVSQYFSMCRAIAEGDNPYVPRVFRRLLPRLRNKADVASNLPAFIEESLKRPLSSRCPWHEHVRTYYDLKNPGVVLLRYEELKSRGAETLAGAMSRLMGEEPDMARAEQSIRKYDFERMTRRKVRHQDPGFLRKGSSGDWVNHFTRESAEIFDRYAGEVLVQAGYEKDRSWVLDVPKSVDSRPRPDRAGFPEHVVQPVH